jgi:phosphoribosylformylglycinamidine synthase
LIKAKVYVTYKEGVLDPQGETVRRSLEVLGYKGIGRLRQGKYFELDLDWDPETGDKMVEEISRRVLSNPVIESFTYQIEKDGEGA